MQCDSCGHELTLLTCYVANNTLDWREAPCVCKVCCRCSHALNCRSKAVFQKAIPYDACLFAGPDRACSSEAPTVVCTLHRRMLYHNFVLPTLFGVDRYEAYADRFARAFAAMCTELPLEKPVSLTQTADITYSNLHFGPRGVVGLLAQETFAEFRDLYQCLCFEGQEVASPLFVLRPHVGCIPLEPRDFLTDEQCEFVFNHMPPEWQHLPNNCIIRTYNPAIFSASVLRKAASHRCPVFNEMIFLPDLLKLAPSYELLERLYKNNQLHFHATEISPGFLVRLS